MALGALAHAVDFDMCVLEYENIYGILIKGDASTKLLGKDDERNFAEHIGCSYFEAIHTTGVCRFAGLCDEDPRGAVVHVAVNAVLEILGFDINAYYPHGLAGNVVITTPYEAAFRPVDVHAIVSLCTQFAAEPSHTKAQESIWASFSQLRKPTRKNDATDLRREPLAAAVPHVVAS